MGAPSITYESPKIEKDDTFEKYLQYQQDRELRLDERAQAATDRSAAAERRRREGGARGFQDYAENNKKAIFSWCFRCWSGSRHVARLYIRL